MCQDERIKEACGVFGIYNPHGEDAASSIYYGLSSLPRTDEPRECFTEFSFGCLWNDGTFVRSGGSYGVQTSQHHIR